jgi:hypothetical protein
MDELQRYIEYLQKSNLTPGSDFTHNTKAFHQWMETHRRQLSDLAKRVGGTLELVDELEQRLANMHPTSEFDSFTARAIFEPILAEVLSATSKTPLSVKRSIVFANHTDISPSAAAMPSSGEHFLFAGVGTFAFCNYWAKTIAVIATSYQKRFGSIPFTQERLHELWSADLALLINTIKLALYCRTFGSLVGFGSMPAKLAETPFRMELLWAMEVFVVAHEVGHCYFEEKTPNQPPSKDDEFACDFYALPILRNLGNRQNSWAAFSGVGAYVFIRAAAISALPQHCCHSDKESTHPAPHERAKAVFATIISVTAEDQVAAVKSYLNDFELLFNELDSITENATQGKNSI